VQDRLYEVLRSNVGYVERELAAGRWTGLRFLRFRPERELRDTLTVAEDRARARAETDDEIVDVEEAVGHDAVVDTLREAIRVKAPAAHLAACPNGYQQPPYPLTVEDRERLYEETSRLLPDVLPRYLPGGPEGWSWRVEPQVASDETALLLRLTPRNERFEDPIVHALTPEEQSSS
jgi:hypothetical protein